MLATSHFNGVPYVITFVSGIAATWVTLYFKVIRPRMQEHKKHEKERDQKRRESDVFMFGGKNTLTGEETISAPRRLRAVELSMDGVASGQKKLEVRMDEANGTGKRTEKKVDDLASLFKSVIAAGAEAKLVTGNGDRHEVSLAPEAHDKIIEAITDTKETS